MHVRLVISTRGLTIGRVNRIRRDLRGKLAGSYAEGFRRTIKRLFGCIEGVTSRRYQVQNAQIKLRFMRRGLVAERNTLRLWHEYRRLGFPLWFRRRIRLVDRNVARATVAHRQVSLRASACPEEG